MASTPHEIENDNPETALRKTLASLDAQRTAIQEEADAIIAELTTPPREGVEPMGLDTPLVDQEGYPRGDIDVYRARSQRNRFRVLKTDHKELEGKVEALLVRLANLKNSNPTETKAGSDEIARRRAPKPKPKYDAVTGKWVVMNWDGSVAGIKDGDKLNFHDLSENRGTQQQTSQSSVPSDPSERSASSVAATSRPPPPREVRRPFARVDGVAVDSPASSAGMKVGDLVTRFGPLHVDNHDRLRALAKLVPEVANERGTIRLLVLRRTGGNDNNGDNNYSDERQWKSLELMLRPMPFPGRGLLGCHIVPCS